MNGCVNITTEQAAKCLSILGAASEPLTAADLAFRLQLAGSRETQRRHIREIIHHLRDKGQMIIATLSSGYWLTINASLWKEYLDGRQIDAKRILAETHHAKKTVLADSSGQGFLFGQRTTGSFITN